MSVTEHKCVRASTGPRRFGRGWMLGLMPDTFVIAMLQWGRAVSGADGGHAVYYC